MKRILISVQNSLLAEAITQMLNDSGEFQSFRSVRGEKNSVVAECEMFSADIFLAEVSYASGSCVEARMKEAAQIRGRMPACKIAFLCDENSAPDIAYEVTKAKKDKLIDIFFYSSVTAKYLAAALISLS